MFDESNSPIDKIELARLMFSTYGLGGEIPNQYKNLVEKILSTFENRIDGLTKIAEMCEDDKSPKALYIKTKAYSWAGAKYRKNTISSALEYLSGDPWEEIPESIINLYGYDINQKDARISEIWTILGMSYDGEYLFDEALDAYIKAAELCPYFISNQIKISKVMVKMNDKEEALSFLVSLRKSKYNKEYREERIDGEVFIENSFTSILEREINDVQNKIVRNYTYKPRNKE